MKQYTKKVSVRNQYRPAKPLGQETAFAKIAADELPRDERQVPAHEDDSHVDDALSLYLHQMGSIALLSRDKELELSRRTDLLNEWVEEVRGLAGKLNTLARTWHAEHDRARQAELRAEWRGVLRQLGMTPRELSGWQRSVESRRRPYQQVRGELAEA